MGRSDSFRGSLDREECSHHIFQHSCLRELSHFSSGHYNHVSSYVTYSSVIVVYYTCDLVMIPEESSGGHVAMIIMIGIVHRFLKVIFMWKISSWQFLQESNNEIKLSALRTSERKKNRQRRYVIEINICVFFVEKIMIGIVRRFLKVIFMWMICSWQFFQEPKNEIKLFVFRTSERKKNRQRRYVIEINICVFFVEKIMIGIVRRFLKVIFMWKICSWQFLQESNNEIKLSALRTSERKKNRQRRWLTKTIRLNRRFADAK